mgnify:CR=1 FL=1|jgi:hypothetical protein
MDIEEKDSSISIYGNENIVGNGKIIVRPEKIFRETTVILSSDDRNPYHGQTGRESKRACLRNHPA